LEASGLNIYRSVSRAIELNRISHAYIISGGDEEAIGLALYLASGVNCLASSGKPCGICSSCRKIHSSNHPDVSITQAEGAVIGIDDIRRLQKDIFVKPYEGKKRVSIIRQGEKMTVQAQNCLLKVLEDPPGTGIIAITTANPANLLPTILSRCQVLKPASKRRIPDAALYRDVLNCFLEGDFVRASAEVGFLAKDDQRSVEDFLDYLFLQVRDMLMLKVAQKEDLLYIKDNGEFAREAAAGYTLGKIGRLLDAVTKARENLRLNVNPQLAMEVLLLEIQEV
jgi:DNA polymerase-3 subunit delta'